MAPFSMRDILYCQHACVGTWRMRAEGACAMNLSELAPLYCQREFDADDEVFHKARIECCCFEVALCRGAQERLACGTMTQRMTEQRVKLEQHIADSCKAKYADMNVHYAVRKSSRLGCDAACGLYVSLSRGFGARIPRVLQSAEQRLQADAAIRRVAGAIRHGTCGNAWSVLHFRKHHYSSINNITFNALGVVGVDFLSRFQVVKRAVCVCVRLDSGGWTSMEAQRQHIEASWIVHAHVKGIVGKFVRSSIRRPRPQTYRGSSTSGG
eukprot:4339260-Amphidinium_carterae.1